MNGANGPDHVRRTAKLGHRKSRNGCRKCKARRVKCDEVRPLCGNCNRLGLECTWPDAPRSPNPPASSYQQVRSGSSPSTVAGGSPETAAGPVKGHQSSAENTQRLSAMINMWCGNNAVDPDMYATSNNQDTIGLPESRARRMLEHRLMQNYLLNLCMPFPISPSQEWTELWSKKLPRMALTYDNLLYAMLSVSATHMLREEPQNLDLFNARQTYLIAALREQRKIVDTLIQDNADAVCFASITILINSFAMLSERVLEPYTPPIEWLQLGKGAGAVIGMSVQAVIATGDYDKSDMITILKSQPRFGIDESYFDADNRADFAGVLSQSLPSGEVWDAETQETYEKTLSYIGSIQKALVRGEPIYVICRRIQGFPVVMPPKFIEFVTEQRPRALVTLAHYFATVSQVNRVWWLGGAEGTEPSAKREIRAIQKALPVEWQGQIMWPLDIAGLSAL